MPKKYVDEIFQLIEQIFELGMNDKGECSALAYSDRLFNRTQLVKNVMLDMGMEVNYDAVGNLVGLKKGKNPHQKIMLASHLDTVFNAGRHDGVLGIVLPIFVLKKLMEDGVKLEKSVEIRVFMAEESPGVTATFGSKLNAGKYTFKDVNNMNLAYQPNVKVVDAINNYLQKDDPSFNLDARNFKEIIINPNEYYTALEIHIEQFYLLQNLSKENNNQPYIGVMRGIGGHLRKNIFLQFPDKIPSSKISDFTYQLTFHGESAHTGATPMDDDYRKNALVYAAEFIKELESQKEIVNNIEFENFKVVNPALTSVPKEVILTIRISLSHKNEFLSFCKEKHNCSLENTASSEHQFLIPSQLIFASAKIVSSLNEFSKKAPFKEHIRGTITQLIPLKKGEMMLYMDVRGADEKAMQNVVKNTLATEISNKITLTTEHISAKKPVLFNHRHVNSTENIVSKAINNQIMKGFISVPGQDIGNIAELGIPSHLLFVESGKGHHPNEYVRPEAMEVAFKSVEALVKYWNTAD